MALTQEPGHLIRRAHQLAVATFRATHGRGITPVQYAILRALREHPGIAVNVNPYTELEQR